jgi:RNA polymerase sigma-70 factor (ECF subfamily)
MKYTASEEIRLLSRLKDGDQHAFNSLFYSYKDKLFGFLLRITGSVEESEDIIQNVFLKIWQERQCADKVKNLNAYIFKIAQNQMIDHVRKYSKEKIQSLNLDIRKEDINPKPDELLFEKEKQMIMQEAVNRLTPQQKKIFVYHKEQGIALKNIAEEMNLSLSTVQNHMNQAIRNIRGHLIKNYNHFLLSPVLFPLFFVK